MAARLAEISRMHCAARSCVREVGMRKLDGAVHLAKSAGSNIAAIVNIVANGTDKRATRPKQYLRC